MPRSDFRQSGNLRRVRHHARRVVWRNQNDGSGSRADLIFEVLEIDGPIARLEQAVMRHRDAAQLRDVVEQRIGRLRRQYFIARLGEKLEAVPVGNAGAGRDDDLLRRDIRLPVITRDGVTGGRLAKGIRLIDTGLL